MGKWVGVWLINLVLATGSVKAVENLVFVHGDHLGSTVLVTSDQGLAVSKQSYFPYGTTRSASAALPTERQYTGQVSDTDETGLYYYNARYYNPVVAKFTQADNANDGLNRYAYVGNNPINNTDPSGHICVPAPGRKCPDQQKPEPQCDPSDYYCRHTLDKSKYPVWYTAALEGNYSQLPPMAFRSPLEMFEFGNKYGLVMLFRRGEEAKRFEKAWKEFNCDLEPNGCTPLESEFWRSEYYGRISGIETAYPDLNIVVKNSDSNPFYDPSSSIIQVGSCCSDLELLGGLEHELTHYFEKIGLVKLPLVNTAYIEGYAYFTQFQLPYENEIYRAIVYVYYEQFMRLEAAGYSDDEILDFYHNNSLFAVPVE